MLSLCFIKIINYNLINKNKYIIFNFIFLKPIIINYNELNILNFYNY